MKINYNIYCDESCYLEQDHINSMALGAIWCKNEDIKKIAKHVKSIKKKHNLSPSFEIKWTKISPSKLEFYSELIDYFFDEKRLHFRTIIIPNKNKLTHEKFNQSHDEWYYKMYFLLLKEILDPEMNYEIYIDIKDTLGKNKIKKLQDILCNNMYDFDKKIIKKIQQIRSNESAILQLTDLLSGAMTYHHRHLNTSEAKNKLIALIKKCSGHNLSQSTLPKENKFNIFIWSPKEW